MIHFHTAAHPCATDAVLLRNGVVELLVAPSIGRILAFRLENDLDSDPLWTNQPNSASWNVGGWANYGGDKLWPAPQQSWNAGGWPPDVAIDSGPYRCECLDDGVHFTGPVSSHFGVYTEREITLIGSAVRFVDRFTRPLDATDPRFDRPVSIWNITQTRGDAIILLPAQDYLLMQGTGVDAILRREGDLLLVQGSPVEGIKIGMVNRIGWMAARFSETVVFSEHFRFEADADYLDHGTNAQVYASLPPTNFEIEVLAGGKVLAPGESLERTLYWNLQRLPSGQANIREAVDVVHAGFPLP